MEPKLENLLPGIEKYLESNEDNISLSGLDDLISKVRSKTGQEKEICATLVRLFFLEIRNAMARGDIVTIRNLGKLYVASPQNSKNKIRMFPKFVPYRKFYQKVNSGL